MAKISAVKSKVPTVKAQRPRLQKATIAPITTKVPKVPSAPKVGSSTPMPWSMPGSKSKPGF